MSFSVTPKSQSEHNAELDVYRNPQAAFRANKIICTIGPNTQSYESIHGLISEGMNVVRMNFSHGDEEFHGRTVANARKASKDLGVHVGIALDTRGPEIRTGVIPEGEITLEKNHKMRLTTDPAWREKGNRDMLFIDCESLTTVMGIGDRIYVDDGLLGLEVTAVGTDYLDVVVIIPSTLSSKKGCNLPNKDVDLPAVSDKDRRDLQWAAKIGVDMVFASFIRNASQVREVRAALGRDDVLVISKIENHQGLHNIDEIIAASDGIMVARGDLGVEIDPEKVFVAQKMIIAKCNIAGKPVICATQMLESMTKNPRPTRAEVSDVANAVLDGADCVMLSGETAKGLYPNTVVNVMSRICKEAQAVTCEGIMFSSIKHLQSVPMLTEESVACSAVNSALELRARAILVLTNTGKTARLIAKYHPPCPIVCVSASETVCRQLAIVRAVFPVFYDADQMGGDMDKEKRVAKVTEGAKSLGFLAPGDLAVCVHADSKTKGFANQTRVISIC